MSDILLLLQKLPLLAENEFAFASHKKLQNCFYYELGYYYYTNYVK